MLLVWVSQGIHLHTEQNLNRLMKEIESAGAFPENVSRVTPLARSSAMDGARRQNNEDGAEAPPCWGLVHTVFGMDRQCLARVRSTLRTAPGCGRAMAFASDTVAFTPRELIDKGFVDALGVNDGSGYALEAMMSLQRTSLGSFAVQLR